MKTKYKILVHVIYWVYIITQTLSTLLVTKLPIDQYAYQDIFWTSFLNMLAFYALYLCLPYFFKNKNKFISVVLSLFLIGVTTAIRFPIDYAFWKYVIVLPEKDLVIQSAWVWNELRMVIITDIYAVLVYITISWFETQKLKADLLNQKQTSELALLRSQMNPHFLFNTLNNIYSLVYKKSDDAPEALMKLSSIMRYAIYDSNTDKVLLEKEVEYLKSFIELQILRFKTNDFVEFNINGSLEGINIAPMLFISFIENAFKHGSKKVESPGIIINLNVSESKTVFEVENYIKLNEIVNKDTAGGIGLHNIKRRLDLLYKDKHKLEIRQVNDKFFIKLEIENK